MLLTSRLLGGGELVRHEGSVLSVIDTSSLGKKSAPWGSRTQVVDDQGNLYCVSYDDGTLNQHLYCLDPIGQVVWAKRLTDLADTSATNYNYITQVLLTSDGERLILVGRKNYHETGTTINAAACVLCFNLDGSLVYNKAYQSSYMNGSYSAALQVQNGVEYLVFAVRVYNANKKNTLGYMVLNAATGQALSLKPSTIIDTESQTLSTLAVGETSFWQVTNLGCLLKADRTVNTCSVNKKFNLRLISSTVLTAYGQFIYWLVPLSSGSYYLSKLDSNGEIIWYKHVIDNGLNITMQIWQDKIYLFINTGQFFVARYDMEGNIEAVRRLSTNVIRSTIKDNKLILYSCGYQVIVNIHYDLDWFFETRYWHFPNPYYADYFKRVSSSNFRLTNATKPTASNLAVTFSTTSYSEAVPFTITNIDPNSLPCTIVYGKNLII